MKFLLSILVIICNLNVLLANNDNCRESDLNALMVRLRQLRTDFAKHAEQINAIQAENKVLKEANDNQETELKKLRQEINNQSSENNTIKDKSLIPIVGFSARLSSSKTTVNGGNRVVFNTVITNQGEGYDNSTGIFTAPYTGLYFFSAHFCHYVDKSVFCAIYQESNDLTKSAQYGGESTCSSASTIAMVNKGERVWVRTLLTSDFYTDAGRWNAFSGSLLNK